jgi:hypothetical protein
MFKEINDRENSKFDGLSSKFYQSRQSQQSRISRNQKNNSFLTEINSYNSLLANEIMTPRKGFNDSSISEIIDDKQLSNFTRS